MNYERERYMRLQEAEHDMIRMRDPQRSVVSKGPHPTPPPPVDELRARPTLATEWLITQILTDIGELPDYTSPYDKSTLLTATEEDIAGVLRRHLEPLRADLDAARAALERLSTPEAFVSASWGKTITDHEAIARMDFARAALTTVATHPAAR